MKIKETVDRKVAILALKGKLMGPPSSTELFERVVDLSSDGFTRFIIDLTHVNWINSLGVGSIVKCLKKADSIGGHLHLVGLTDKVRSVFVMSQLVKILTIHDDLASASTKLNEI